MLNTSFLKFVCRISLGCLSALLLGQGAAAQTVVRINGTGSGTGSMQVLAKAFMQERTAGAFAVSTLALIKSEKRPLTALAIDGKVPTVADLGNGSFPHFKSLDMVFAPNAGSNTKLFAAFVQSTEGRALLRAHGHVPG